MVVRAGVVGPFGYRKRSTGGGWGLASVGCKQRVASQERKEIRRKIV